MLQQLPLTRCGIAITAKALQKSFCHEMVVVQHRQGRGVVLRDAHVQDAVLWRSIACGADFVTIAGCAVVPDVTLQQAACCAALFQAGPACQSFSWSLPNLLHHSMHEDLTGRTTFSHIIPQI